MSVSLCACWEQTSSYISVRCDVLWRRLPASLRCVARLTVGLLVVSLGGIGLRRGRRRIAIATVLLPAINLSLSFHVCLLAHLRPAVPLTGVVRHLFGTLCWLPDTKAVRSAHTTGTALPG
jgi:hypothetical protein